MYKNLFLSVDIKLEYNRLKKIIPKSIKKIINNINNFSSIHSYEDNIDEIIKIENIICLYTDEDRIKIANEYNNFFDKFLSINKSLDVDVKKLNEYINYLILKLKFRFNRTRPFTESHKYNKNIFVVALDTIYTPSYPSGHSASGRFLYRYFSDIDPNNEKKYFKLMNKISLGRILAGVHYISDCEGGILYADILYDSLKNKKLI
jgi:hypothetical protein